MGIHSSQRKTYHPPKKMECWDSKALKCAEAIIEHPEAQDIPQEWICTTVELYTKDACWCQAVYLGVSNFLKNEEALDRYMKKVFTPRKMEKAMGPVKKEIRGAKWGDVVQLCEPQKQTLAYGVFRSCDSQKDKNCIFLNSNLSGVVGLQQPSDLFNSSSVLRDVVLPHESVHKLFSSLNFMSGALLEVFEAGEVKRGLKKPLTPKEWCQYESDMAQVEEDIVRDITKMHFGNSRYFRDALNHFPRGLHGQLLKSCSILPTCVRSSPVLGAADMPPYGVTLITSPGSLLPPLPPVDFNNDGIKDFADDFYAPYHLALDYRYEVRGWGTFRIRPDLWPDVTPHLQSPLPKYDIWLHRYWGCPVPKATPHTTAWSFDRANAQVWPDVFTRFFNSDRSMYFIPNQKVEWQVEGAVRRGIVQSLIVLLNPQTGAHEGKPYAEMEKCQMISLDHLRWVTKDRRSVDMRKALFGALQFMGPLPQKSAMVEDELANLVRTAHWASSQSYLTSSEARRDELVRVLKDSPLFDQLIYFWEDVVVMAVGLPVQHQPKKNDDPHPTSTKHSNVSLNP